MMAFSIRDETMFTNLPLIEEASRLFFTSQQWFVMFPFSSLGNYLLPKHTPPPNKQTNKQ